jgi:hypothetical protein
MKNLILFALLFIPFSLIAQIEVENRKTSMNDQTDDWMVKISSDSEMRVQIMDMIIEKTKGDTEEMQKLANSILNSPELSKMISEVYPERAGSDDLLVDPLGIVKENINVGKMSGAQPIPTAPKK